MSAFELLLHHRSVDQLRQGYVDHLRHRSVDLSRYKSPEDCIRHRSHIHGSILPCKSLISLRQSEAVTWRNFIGLHLLYVMLIAQSLIGRTSGEGSNLNLWHFDDVNGSTFQQIAVDDETGQVFAAGLNTLYRFNKILERLDFCQTGPVMDCDTTIDRTCVRTDNDAKVFQISPHLNRILYCGSGLSGLCSVYQMNDLRLTQSLNESRRSSYTGGKVEVMAVMRSKYIESNSAESTIYLASIPDGQYHPLSSPALSARELSLSSTSTLELNFKTTTKDQRTMLMDFNSALRSVHIVRYVHGFVSDGFVYFVTVQKDSTTGDNYDTRLVRFCQSDFTSYSELSLTCRKKSSLATFFNVAQAGVLSGVGNDTARRFGLKYNEEVLYLTMGRSDMGSWQASEEYGSGLCMFFMHDIRQHFVRAQKECYQRQGQT